RVPSAHRTIMALSTRAMARKSLSFPWTRWPCQVPRACRFGASSPDEPGGTPTPVLGGIQDMASRAIGDPSLKRRVKSKVSRLRWCRSSLLVHVDELMWSACSRSRHEVVHPSLRALCDERRLVGA